ncbi:response regulator [Bogoriella caseilytica]|uniref:Transcriptional regulatory protein KdpE n=1 Tax=Bogoriella caseilytica TaxID=56055 RepID=A0A3N2BC35_9MICO|nr:response regulator transcription factor [Bogoriella caseilytica]ROR72788.1 two-component system KDP operon response regulator KdpE [Bogoriella caseilytica]
MIRLLLVEDDPALVRTLVIVLEAHGYAVRAVTDGRSALSAVREQQPDLVVLDLGLPDLDGLDLVETVRPWYRAPILVLSARDAETTKVHALRAGADDYVTKPFGVEELLARIEALLRRSDPASDTVRSGDLAVDLAAHRVERDGDEVHLTPTEWRMLEVLVRARGALVSQQALLQTVWGPQYARETNYLRVYLAQLRHKLEDDPARPRHLLTEPGAGYRFR